jgi:surface antigen
MHRAGLALAPFGRHPSNGAFFIVASTVAIMNPGRDTFAIMSKALVLAPLVAAALAVGLVVTSGSPSAHGALVLRGYPYASRCPAGGYKDKVDRWGMYVCNCTSYVAWALRANGQRTNWFIRGAMNAWNWPHVARLKHIPIGSRPRVGSVAVWPKLAQPFGHVAYVSRVDDDGGFDVGEYNLPEEDGGNPYAFDTRRDVTPNGAVFIYVPARRVP